MNLRVLILFCLFFVTNAAQAQFYRGVKEVDRYRIDLKRIDVYLQSNPDQVDELYQELLSVAHKDKNKTLETVLYIYKGTQHYYSGESDEAIEYFDKAIEIGSQIESRTLLSTARIRRIFVLGERSDSKIAYQFMKEELEIAKNNKDTLNMIYALNGLNLFGKHEENSGFNATMKALKLAEESGNEYEYGFLINNLGVTKLNLGDTDGALNDFQKALRIAKKVENTRLELTVMDNMGYYYVEIDSLSLAEKTFIDVFGQATEKKHHQLALTAMVNLGGLYRAQGDLKKSDSLMTESLAMAKNTNMYYMVSLIYLNQAQLELMNGNYDMVVTHLDSVGVYARYTTNTDVKAGQLKISYLMNKKMGDFEEALNYYKEWKDFEDSLDNNGHIQMITEMQLRYDVEREEKEHVQQKNAYEQKLAEKALNEEKLKRNYAIGIILLVIVLAIVIIYYFRSKQKRESEFSQALVNRLEEERGRIARDLHDGLGQSLVILKNKFNKMNPELDPLANEINDNFSETIEEVRSISRSLIPPELRRLGLRKSLDKMLKDVEHSTGIVVTTDLDALESLHLGQAHEIRLYRIIQELTSNTIKHARATSLKVEVIHSGSSFSIIYQDNGIGMSPDKGDGSGYSVGLQSIQQRLKFMGGSIKYEKPPRGFKAVIKIKYKTHADSVGR